MQQGAKKLNTVDEPAERKGAKGADTVEVDSDALKSLGKSLFLLSLD